MCRVGFLPTVGAEALITVLDAMADRSDLFQEDGVAKARADALVRLAEDHLRSGRAAAAAQRADSGDGGDASGHGVRLPGAPPARTGRGQALLAAEAHMLACEAALRGVLVDGEGEILWQGRRHATRRGPQYEALGSTGRWLFGDRCDRLASQCDAHHDVPWTAGGHTDVARCDCCVGDTIARCTTNSGDASTAGRKRAQGDRTGSRSDEERKQPWYMDTPAWYPGPSPWRPSGASEARAIALRAGDSQYGRRSTESDAGRVVSGRVQGGAADQRRAGRGLGRPRCRGASW